MSEHLRSPGTDARDTDSPLDSAAENGRSHVLIVDDHAPSRRICASYCDLFDHTTQLASGPGDAIAALKRERFHAVVMSVHMAQASTLETLRAIRELPGPAGEIPVIGLTAVGRGEEAQRWLGAGFAGMLAKPITAARLYAALSMAIDRDDEARAWMETD